jgi:hypothetical protein
VHEDATTAADEDVVVGLSVVVVVPALRVVESLVQAMSATSDAHASRGTPGTC